MSEDAATVAAVTATWTAVSSRCLEKRTWRQQNHSACQCHAESREAALPERCQRFTQTASKRRSIGKAHLCGKWQDSGGWSCQVPKSVCETLLRWRCQSRCCNDDAQDARACSRTNVTKSLVITDAVCSCELHNKPAPTASTHTTHLQETHMRRATRGGAHSGSAASA